MTISLINFAPLFGHFLHPPPSCAPGNHLVGLMVVPALCRGKAAENRPKNRLFHQPSPATNKRCLMTSHLQTEEFELLTRVSSAPPLQDRRATTGSRHDLKPSSETQTWIRLMLSKRIIANFYFRWFGINWVDVYNTAGTDHIHPEKTALNIQVCCQVQKDLSHTFRIQRNW